jgi:uncharacterized protein (DUF362 family)
VKRPSVVVESLEGVESRERVIHEVIERAQVGHAWGSGDPVFLKPNLTYPTSKPGVTTRVEFIETVARYFLAKGCRVTIGEGPGGYNGFKMKEAFEAHGLTAAAQRLGVSLVELSDWEVVSLSIESRRGKHVAVPIPKPLLHDFRGIVSLPVPKVHCMTGVSLGLKNMWGCVSDVFRIRFHPYLDEILAALLKALRIEGAILDGWYGLDENGPMVDGVVKELRWVAASQSCGAHDVAVTKLLGFDPMKISHLRYAMQLRLVPPLDGVDVNSGIVPQRFALKLNLWNRLAKLTWIHPRLTWLVYISPFAGLIHWLMYLVRKKPKELTVRTVGGWQQ